MPLPPPPNDIKLPEGWRIIDGGTYSWMCGRDEGHHGARVWVTWLGQYGWHTTPAWGGHAEGVCDTPEEAITAAVAALKPLIGWIFVYAEHTAMAHSKLEEVGIHPRARNVVIILWDSPDRRKMMGRFDPFAEGDDQPLCIGWTFEDAKHLYLQPAR